MNTVRIDRSMLGNTVVVLALIWLAVWFWQLQDAAWPTPSLLPGPRLAAGIALVAYAAFCGWIAWAGRRPQAILPAASEGAQAWKVAYASQTGFALELAEHTVQVLRDAGAIASLHDIARLDVAQMRGAHWLFVTSTTGEGDPPDHALAFANRALAQTPDLKGMCYAVLAVGNREYANFCAFGHKIDDWLRRQGAQPLFDLVEVDNADPGALRHWQHQLGLLIGRTDLSDWSRPRYQRWTLVERRLLNPGSLGGPAFHLVLQPPPHAPLAWQAGDIAEIGPRNAAADVEALLSTCGFDGSAMIEWQDEPMPLAEALSRARLPAPEEVRGRSAAAIAASLQPLPHREYSIASIPADDNLQLLVRLMQREDGSPGIGSGWLCTHAAIGDGIDLRLRSNPGFHAPDPARPMILVGNGTGLAGLRAHLKARIAAGARRNWLLFGERSARHDRFHGEELDTWLRDGQLTHLDLVYSRDGGDLRYVQDALRARSERLRTWLNEGAAIHVCGSLEGMAPGVDDVLVDLLGRPAVDALVEAGRYRRDVY